MQLIENLASAPRFLGTKVCIFKLRKFAVNPHSNIFSLPEVPWKPGNLEYLGIEEVKRVSE